MKKFIAFILSLTVAAGVTACSSKSGGEEPGTEQSFTVTKLTDVAYKKSSLDIPEDMTALYSAMPFSGGEKKLIIGGGAAIPAFWTCSSGFTDFAAVDYPDFDIGVMYSMDTADDGTLAEFLVYADYGGEPAPDPFSEDYDADYYDRIAEYSFMIRTYSTDGQLISANTVTGFNEAADRSSAVGAVVFDGEYLLAELDGDYQLFSADGKYIGAVAPGEGESIQEVGKDSSGRLVCAVQPEFEKLRLQYVNTADGSLESSDTTYDFPETVQNQIAPGSGGYSMFLTTRTTIYGVKESDRSIEPLFSLTASNLSNSSIKGFSLCDDGDLIISEYDFMGKPKIRRFTACTPEEMASVTRLTFGTEDDYYIKDIVEKFNEQSDDFQIDIVLYDSGSTTDSYQKFTDQITQDALSGSLPDLLCMWRDGDFGTINMVDIDALVDLNPFLDSSESLSRDNILPSVLKCCEFDSKLEFLSNCFALDLGLVGKEKFVGDIEDWSFDSYMTLLENMPEGVLPTLNFGEYNETKQSRYSLFSDFSWIDIDNATGNFDSDSFIRVLKYVDAAPNAPSYFADSTEYVPPTQDEMERWSYLDRRKFLDDTAMLDHVTLLGYDQYMSFIKGQFGSEPVRILGNPEFDGAHTYVDLPWWTVGITKSSEHQSEAWQFIEYMLSDESYDSPQNSFGFPITYTRMAMQAEAVKKADPSYIDSTEYFYWDGEKQISLGHMTDEDIAYIDQLIAEAEPAPRVKGFGNIDTGNSFYDIRNEEIDSFFHGDIAPEQCAERLQSRISIFLSEQFG